MKQTFDRLISRGDPVVRSPGITLYKPFASLFRPFSPRTDRCVSVPDTIILLS